MKTTELQTLRKYAGDLSGLYGMEDFTYNEGKAKGMRAIRLRNGRGLCATLVPDRCLDITQCSYKDINIGLILKAGISAPAYYPDGDDLGFRRQFNGGLMTTCGLLNTGPTCEVDGRLHGQHGRIHSIPGENVCKEEIDEGGEIFLQTAAEMREASLFGEYVVLKRKVKMETERNCIIIQDVQENRGFSPIPLVNMYHVNFGYPLLDEGAKLYFSTPDISPRDKAAEMGLANYGVIEAPENGKAEECFIHTGGQGMQFGLIHNEKLGLGAAVHFNIEDLPLFCQWKSMSSGDYALGLEPSAAGFWGLKRAKELGLVKYLKSGESKRYEVAIEILDSAGAIEALIARCK